LEGRLLSAELRRAKKWGLVERSVWLLRPLPTLFPLPASPPLANFKRLLLAGCTPDLSSSANGVPVKLRLDTA